MVFENYNEVKDKLNQACKVSGRDPEEVLLLPVSKTKPVSMMQELMDHGIMDFGENYIQELCGKIDEVKEPVRWHLIGHLQRNKVKYIIGRTHLIHSVDSLRLAEEIQKEAVKREIPSVDILIEVNMAGEESKDGICSDDAVSLVNEIAKLPNIHVCGLMTIAPFVEDPEENRPVFRAMRELRDKIAGLSIPNVDMKELSMGMTNDFEVAVQEGATIIRVGTAIFGARDYSKK